MMKKMYLFLIAALFASSAIIAQTTTVWNPAGNPASTGLWTEAENWTGGVVPDGDFKVVLNVVDAAECVLDDTVSIAKLVAGDGGPGSLRIAEGGNLTTTAGWSAVGWTGVATLTVDTGGVVTFGEHLWVGWTDVSSGTVILNGGTINVTAMYGTAFEGGGGTGAMMVKSGTLNLTGLHPDQSLPDGGMIDIEQGVINLPGDLTGTVNNYVAAGKITGFGGLGEVLVNLVDGNTVITAFDPTAPRDITDEMPIQFVGSNENDPWPGTGSPAGEALPFLFDNDVNTKYLVGDDSTWIDVITTVESIVTSYTITSANDAPTRDPRDWRFMGWNVSEGKWDTLHMVDDNPSWPDFFTPQTWEFENDMAYSTYRLAIDSINYDAQNLMQISEFEIIGSVQGKAELDVTDWGLVDLTSEFDDIPWDGPGTGSPGGEIPPYLVDNDVNTKVLTGNTDVWIDILTNYKSVVTGYTIFSANDAPERDPKDWTLQGWNAETGMWDTLHVVVENPSWPDFFTPKSWTFENDMAYSKYRLDIDSVNGAPLMQISELQLLGTLGEEVMVDITDLRDVEYKGQHEDLPWDGPGTGSPDGEALPFLFDNDTTTKYLVGIVEGFVDILTPRLSMVTSYTMTSANDAPGRDPASWVLQGWDFMNEEWIDIHSVTDQGPWASRAMPMTWEFENESYFSTYRMMFLANNGEPLLQIAELELFAHIGDTTSIKRPNYPTPPDVLSIDPANFATDVALDATVTIEFSEPMSASSIEANLSVTPEIPNMSLKWSIFGDKLSITGDMVAETTYNILIPAGTMDAEGDELMSDFRSKFTTEKADVTGLEGRNSQEMGFYPNPASSMIYLSSESLADVDFYNEVGQHVMAVKQVRSVNVEALAAGRYIVKITSDDTVSVASLIVE